MAAAAEFWGDTQVSRASVADWVAAEPFRAWVAELLEGGDLTLEELAELAMVSRRALQRLLHGRGDGSTLRKISPDLARRLLRVRSGDVRGLAHRMVPSALMVQALVDLLTVDGRVDALAERVGVDETDIWAVLRGARDCRQLLAIRIRTAAEDLRAEQYRRHLCPCAA